MRNRSVGVFAFFFFRFRFFFGSVVSAQSLGFVASLGTAPRVAARVNVAGFSASCTDPGPHHCSATLGTVRATAAMAAPLAYSLALSLLASCWCNHKGATALSAACASLQRPPSESAPVSTAACPWAARRSAAGRTHKARGAADRRWHVLRVKPLAAPLGPLGFVAFLGAVPRVAARVIAAGFSASCTGPGPHHCSATLGTVRAAAAMSAPLAYSLALSLMASCR